MHKGMWLLCGLLVTASPALGQSELPSIPLIPDLPFLGTHAILLPPQETRVSYGEPAKKIAETKPAVADLTRPAVVDLGGCGSCCGPSTWGSVDYLLWWTKSAPVPQPMVTTGDPNVGLVGGLNTAGGIGQPGTQVLFGNQNVNFGAFSGGRIVLGTWLDSERTVGIEASGFLLETRSSTFIATSNAAGNPPLYFPEFNVQTGFEAGNQIADPLRLFAGNVFITNELQLWGTELNGCFLITRRPGFEAQALVGFRYMDLRENLYLHNATTDLLFLNVQTSDDAFSTRNQFYGGQLGLRGVWERNRLTAYVTGKIALGNNHEAVTINGVSTEAALPGGFAPTPGTFGHGIYAMPTNMGRVTNNQFSVIPAVELKLAYQVSSAVKVFAGYDFLYWNQVVRPGNQVDHNVNQSQSVLFGVGNLVGQPAPLNPFAKTDFWAQGVSFGLLFQF